MIQKASEMDFSRKPLAIIVAGVPGIGKTTLALSAPKPLLVDIDGGVSRVDAMHRKDTMTVSTYDELRKELKESDLSEYETIVIDTGGKLFELIKPAVIKESQKNGKQDGSLSLQGYGAAKRKFSEFVGFVKGLGKNLVMVFHASEVTLSDQEHLTGLRIRIEGSSKDEVWDDMDLGGFVEMKGNKRTIGFGNCDRYYAKGTHGIHGVYDIPDLAQGGENDFLAKLFKEVRDDLNRGVKAKADYDADMGLKEAIDEAGDELAINKAFQAIQDGAKTQAAKRELWTLIVAKAKSLGLEWNPQGRYFG